jgi:hypothetical protein
VQHPAQRSATRRMRRPHRYRRSPREERTRDVFGDYVSVYNFSQSIADGATVPLYYEARKPEYFYPDLSGRTRCGEITGRGASAKGRLPTRPWGTNDTAPLLRYGHGQLDGHAAVLHAVWCAALARKSRHECPPIRVDRSAVAGKNLDDLRQIGTDQVAAVVHLSFRSGALSTAQQKQKQSSRTYASLCCSSGGPPEV